VPLAQEDLEKIEARMREVVAADRPFEREEVTREEALKRFADQPYKVELIKDLPEGETISIYRHGDFVDLCRGPHVPSTGQVGEVKLLNVAGAYWRGDEHRPMLQRIYGTAFETAEEVEDFLRRREEIARRDHRRLGKDLGLYSVDETVGPGLILWHPKGARIRNIIEDFWRSEHYKAGYELVFTPHIARKGLWQESGHLDFFNENMFAPMSVEGVDYLIKPMNCPFHLAIYKSNLHSYREFPIRYAELGTVYRFERSGVLHGLLRVRGFTQDDAHILCRPDQLEVEVKRVLDFNMYMIRSFGFTQYDVYLSTRPEHYVGTVDNWDKATAALRLALEDSKMPYEVDPGEGVFYGPKIDIKIKDALGRSWQCSTIQVDFNEPERFDITYIGEDSQQHRPIMIHRALLGSMERFVGVLIEHYVGAFPLWLAPVQARIIPIADRHLDYGEELNAKLREAGLRAEVDTRRERMNLKIREAQLQKVPYMLIIGDKEAASGSASVRLRSGEDQGPRPIDEIIAEMKSAVANRE
jgi:threonyl-tRNA synthetase